MCIFSRSYGDEAVNENVEDEKAIFPSNYVSLVSLTVRDNLIFNI